MAPPEGVSVTDQSFFKSIIQNRAVVSASDSLIASIRSAADARLLEMDQPSTRDEEWRFTNLNPLYRSTFEAVKSTSFKSLTESARIAETDGARFVFINGEYNVQLSDVSELSNQVKVVHFSQADADDSKSILEHLNAHMSLDNDAFLTLNASVLTDGIWIDLPANVVVDRPIHLLFVSASETVATSAPRVLVTAGKHANATVIEESIGTEGDVYLNIPVLEFDLDRGAHVTHVKVQRESKQAFHIGRVGATIARDGHYESYSIQLGARISRNDVVATQHEESMYATLDGLVLISGDQLSDTHTVMDHAKPHGESHQLHKCLVDGKATSVFNGKIFVRQDAQKVNSFQENRNLLLSESGTVYTKPQLEIFADDVKCSHGATIGQLREEELFYLKSRGLDLRSATEILTQAFALEVIQNIKVDSLRDRLTDIVTEFTHQRIAEDVTA